MLYYSQVEGVQPAGCPDQHQAHRTPKGIENKEDETMMNLNEKKANALEAFKNAREAWMENQSNENWIAFCDAKLMCRRLGILV